MGNVGRRQIRRRLLIRGAAGLGLLSLVGAGAVLRRPSADAPDTGALLVSTTTIRRGTLIDITTAPGQLGYGPEQLIDSRLTGTVTGLPPVGTVVGRGQVLFRVDDLPVVLLFGGLPAYRDLTAGHPATPDPTPGAGVGGGSTGAEAGAVPATKGADVKQFEKNLQALGYSLTVDEQYTQQTAAIVRKWQKGLGLPQTGVVELGRVFYAPGPVRVAQHKLTAGAVTSGPILAGTGAARLITAKLPGHDQALAKVNTKVTVALPSGKEVPGTVMSVSNSATDDQAGSGQEPALDVVVTLDDSAMVNGLDDGPVQVRFVAEQRKDVLMVPVGALLALAEGGYGLEIIEAGSTRVVATTTGLFADGKVEVSGPDIRDGMTVGMAR